jgi:hypothetical protein
MRIGAEATRRRREIEPSIRRGDRRRIIRECVLHRQDGVFGMDKGASYDAQLFPSVYSFGGEIQPDSPQLKAISDAIWKAGAG